MRTRVPVAVALVLAVMAVPSAPRGTVGATPLRSERPADRLKPEDDPTSVRLTARLGSFQAATSRGNNSRRRLVPERAWTQPEDRGIFAVWRVVRRTSQRSDLRAAPSRRRCCVRGDRDRLDIRSQPSHRGRRVVAADWYVISGCSAALRRSDTEFGGDIDSDRGPGDRSCLPGRPGLRRRAYRLVHARHRSGQWCRNAELPCRNRGARHEQPAATVPSNQGAAAARPVVFERCRVRRVRFTLRLSGVCRLRSRRVDQQVTKRRCGPSRAPEAGAAAEYGRAVAASCPTVQVRSCSPTATVKTTTPRIRTEYPGPLTAREPGRFRRPARRTAKWFAEGDRLLLDVRRRHRRRT